MAYWWSGITTKLQFLSCDCKSFLNISGNACYQALSKIYFGIRPLTHFACVSRYNLKIAFKFFWVWLDIKLKKVFDAIVKTGWSQGSRVSSSLWFHRLWVGGSALADLAPLNAWHSERGWADSCCICVLGLLKVFHLFSSSCRPGNLGFYCSCGNMSAFVCVCDKLKTTLFWTAFYLSKVHVHFVPVDNIIISSLIDRVWWTNCLTSW